MIQRIQSIFLAFVVIFGGTAFFLPVIELSCIKGDYTMDLFNTVSENNLSLISQNMGLDVLQGLILVVAIVIIGLYKKRSLQVKLGKLNILLISLEIAAIVFYSDIAKSGIGINPDAVDVSLELGVIIPVISLILTYLAIRFIKKDDALIRSADRLR